ncbi:multidrug efflux ABC transporter permease LieB [Actinomadura kijaniata]|uniref:Transport permease protein n=1 Tax=Actinomadura namibiensis TaxID=182080 RepID=A0A7W3LS50_ACTNM|nr:ABC transporter permease [Actinomadura namibiensis]MBA8953298.1 ABC-2 type transport system permease protein [Actinomadura namibiensis]
MSDLLAWPVLAGRGLRLSMRNLEALLISLMLPVLLMLLFVYIFGGAIRTDTDYVTYAVPGVLLLCCSYGASLTAVGVAEDMTQGVVDRFRSMDVGGPALLAAHVTASTLRNLLSTAMVMAVALLIGFRPDAGPLGWLAGLGVLVAFVVAMSAVSAAVGLVAKTTEAASGFTFFVLFLPYPSSAFVPVDTMPGWLHGFAEHQPATPIIESVRGLLLDQPVGGRPWTALAWCGALLLVSVALSGPLFRRRTR